MDFKTENAKIATRVKEIQAKYDLMSENKFASKIDVPQRTFNHQMNEGNALSLEVVLKILSTFPEIDANWLIKGEGSMLTAENAKRIALENADRELIHTLQTTLNMYNKYLGMGDKLK